MRNFSKTDFTVPALLVVLSLVPTLGGVMRLINISSGAAVTPDNARFVQAPVPIAIHVACATLYCLLGAFQFSPGFRRRWPRVHRRAGRLLAVCGLLAGVTGVWMTVFYRIPAGMQGPLLYVVRVAVGVAMIAAIFVAWSSILRRGIGNISAASRRIAPSANYAQRGLLPDYQERVAGSYEPPSLDTFALLLGTDVFGRSVLYKILAGTKTAMMIGLLVPLIAVPIGVTLGAVAGYYGGSVDAFIVWLFSVISSLPYILIVIAISFVLGKGMIAICVAMGSVGWGG